MKILTATPVAAKPLTDQWQVVGAKDHATAVHDTTVVSTATVKDAQGATYYAHVEDLSRIYNAYTYATQDMVGLRHQNTIVGHDNDGSSGSYAATGGDYFAYVNDISDFEVGQMVAILEGLQEGEIPYSAEATSADAYYSEWIELATTGLVPVLNPRNTPTGFVTYDEVANALPEKRHISAVLLPNQDFIPLSKNPNLWPQLSVVAPNQVGHSQNAASFYLVLSPDAKATSNLNNILPDFSATSAGVSVTFVAIGSTSTQVKVSSVTGFAVGQNLTVSAIPSSGSDHIGVGWGCGVITGIDTTNNVLTTDLTSDYVAVNTDIPTLIPPRVYGFQGSSRVGASPTGTTTSGSAVITSVTSVANIGRGATISGTGIPAGATVVSVDSATQITISANCTSSGTLRTLTVGSSPAIMNIKGYGGTPLSAATYKLAKNSAIGIAGITGFPGASSISAVPAYSSYEGAVIVTNGSATVTSTDNIWFHVTATATQLSGVSFTTGSTTVTVTSTANITAGMYVIGVGITPGTTVASVTNGTQFVLSANPVANSVSGQALSTTSNVYDFSSALTDSFYFTSARLNGSPNIYPTAPPIGGFSTVYSTRNSISGTVDGSPQQNILNGYIQSSANAASSSSGVTTAIDYSVDAAKAFGSTVSGKTVRVNTPTGNALDCVFTSSPYYIADSYDSPNHGGYYIAPLRVANFKSRSYAQVVGYEAYVDSSNTETVGVSFYANLDSTTSIMEVASLVGLGHGCNITGDAFPNTSGPYEPTVRYDLVGNTTSGSKTVTLTTGTTANLVTGIYITGTGIPANTTIASITNSTQFLLSANATASNTGVNLYPDFSGKSSLFISKTATPTGNIESGSAVISNLSSTAHLIIGATITGTGIPSGTTITAVDTTNLEITISQVATATTTGATVSVTYYCVPLGDASNAGVPLNPPATYNNTLLWSPGVGVKIYDVSDTATLTVSPNPTFTGVITRVYTCTTTSGSPVITMASSAVTYPGASVTGTNISGTATVVAVINSTTIIIDANATASGSTSLTIDTNAISGISASDAANLSIGDQIVGYGGYLNDVYIGAITSVGATYTISVVGSSNSPALWDRSNPYEFGLPSSLSFGTRTFSVLKPTIWYNESTYAILSIDSANSSVVLAQCNNPGGGNSGDYTNGDDATNIYPLDNNIPRTSALTTPTADGNGAGVVMFKGTIVGNHKANTIVAGYDEGARYFGSTTVGDLETITPITVGSLFGTTLAIDISANSSQNAIVNPLPFTDTGSGNQYGFTSASGAAYTSGTQISSCAVTAGSNKIIVPAANEYSNVTIGWIVTGMGIPAGTYVTAITERVITISNAATVSSPSTGASIQFMPVVWGVMIVGVGETQEALVFSNTPVTQGELFAYTPLAGQAYTYDHFAGEPIVVANITTEGFAYQHAKGAPVLGSADYEGSARTQLVATNYAAGTAVTAEATMQVSTPWTIAGQGDGSASISTSLALPAAVGDTTLTLTGNDLFPSAYPEVYQANAFCPPEIGRVAGYVASGVYVIPFVPGHNIPNSSDFYVNIGGQFLEVIGVNISTTGATLTVSSSTTTAFADLTPIHLSSYVVGESYSDVTVPHFYLNRSFAGTTTLGSDSVTVTKTVTNLAAGLSISGTGIPAGAKIGSFSSGTGATGSVLKMVDSNNAPLYATASGTVTVTAGSSIAYGDTVTTLYTTPLPYTIPSGSTITLNFGRAQTTCVTNADATAGTGSISVASFTSPYSFTAVVGENGVLFPTDVDSTDYGAYGVYGLTAGLPQKTITLLSCNGNYQQIVPLDNVSTSALSFGIEPFTAGYAFDDTDATFTFTASTNATAGNDYTLTSASGAGFANLRVGQQIFASSTYLTSAFVRSISGTTITIDSAVSATGAGVTFTVYGTTYNKPYPLTLDTGLLAETIIPADIPTVNADGLTYSLPLSAGVVYPHTTGVSLAYYAQSSAPKNGDILYRPDLDSFQYFDGVEWHDAAIVEVSTTYAIQGASDGGDKTSFYLVDPDTGATSAPDIVINAPTAS